jgi:hypothetical protein
VGINKLTTRVIDTTRELISRLQGRTLNEAGLEEISKQIKDASAGVNRITDRLYPTGLPQDPEAVKRLSKEEQNTIFEINHFNKMALDASKEIVKAKKKLTQKQPLLKRKAHQQQPPSRTEISQLENAPQDLNSRQLAARQQRAHRAIANPLSTRRKEMLPGQPKPAQQNQASASDFNNSNIPSDRQSSASNPASSAPQGNDFDALLQTISQFNHHVMHYASQFTERLSTTKTLPANAHLVVPQLYQDCTDRINEVQNALRSAHENKRQQLEEARQGLGDCQTTLGALMRELEPAANELNASHLSHDDQILPEELPSAPANANQTGARSRAASQTQQPSTAGDTAAGQARTQPVPPASDANPARRDGRGVENQPPGNLPQRRGASTHRPLSTSQRSNLPPADPNNSSTPRSQRAASHDAFGAAPASDRSRPAAGSKRVSPDGSNLPNLDFFDTQQNSDRASARQPNSNQPAPAGGNRAGVYVDALPDINSPSGVLPDPNGPPPPPAGNLGAAPPPPPAGNLGAAPPPPPPGGPHAGVVPPVAPPAVAPNVVADLERRLYKANMRLMAAQKRFDQVTEMAQLADKEGRSFQARVLRNDFDEDDDRNLIADSNELQRRKVALTKAKEEVTKITAKLHQDPGSDAIDLEAAYDEALQAVEDADRAEDLRREYARDLAVATETATNQLTEKRQREFFTALNKDKDLIEHTEAVIHLNRLAEEMDGVRFDAATFINLEFEILKMQRDLEDYLEVLRRAEQEANDEVYGNLLSAWGTRDNIRKNKKPKVQQLIATLNAARETLYVSIDKYNQGIVEIKHYKPDFVDADEEVITYDHNDQAERTRVDGEIQRYIGTLTPDKATAALPSRVAIVRGVRDDKTTGDFISRFVPSGIVIKKQNSLFCEAGEYVPIAIKETVNTKKTYHKQTLHAAKLSEIDRAPTEEQWRFAKEIIDRGKASVAKGPIYIPSQLPKKFKIALEAMCIAMGEKYQIDQKSEKAVSMATDIETAWGKDINKPFLAGKVKELNENTLHDMPVTAPSPRPGK